MAGVAVLSLIAGLAAFLLLRRNKRRKVAALVSPQLWPSQYTCWFRPVGSLVRLPVTEPLHALQHCQSSPRAMKWWLGTAVSPAWG